MVPLHLQSLSDDERTGLETLRLEPELILELGLMRAVQGSRAAIAFGAFAPAPGVAAFGAFSLLLPPLLVPSPPLPPPPAVPSA